MTTTPAFTEAADTTQKEIQEVQRLDETHDDAELQERSSDEPLVDDPMLMARFNEEMSQLEHERDLLQQQRRAAMRDTERMTEEMKEEVLEMLQVLGLPYIVAPMEAEAQCAVLEALGVVDGVVTEDSDAFLFGAQTVYKNIFDERKYVEVFLASDAERELGITRNEFVSVFA
jgi:DNA excision repair protein ERCC-5